jgi:glycine betaine/proline transport system substrate-binding protein
MLYLLLFVNVLRNRLVRVSKESFSYLLMRLKNVASDYSLLSLFLISVLFFSLVSCSGEQTQPTSSSETIKLAYADWAEGVALNSLATVILDEKLGYQVETRMAPVPKVFELIGKGDYDLFVDAWLPKTHQRYYQNHQSQLEDLGPLFTQARIGLVVPTYMKVNSIADLPTHAKSFRSKIIGIEETAGIMEATKRAIDDYGLTELQIMATSGSVMTDSLEQAILRREPIVITGWVPHWKWAEYNLKFLEDPKGVFGSDEQIHALAHKGFADAHPRAAEFLRRMQLNRVQLADLMDKIRLSEALPTQTAKEWMEENPAIVNDWIRGLRPERTKVM